VKRTGILVLGVIALLALSPGVASAKIPPFTVEASPNDPTAGDVVRLTVRFWDDPEHTDPARWVDFRLRGFLWAHPAGSMGETTSIDLRLVQPGVYRAEMTVGSPGRWILCPWQRRCNGERTPGFPDGGYPDRIELEVASSAPDTGGAFPSADPSGSRVPVPLLALAALVVSAAVLVGRFGLRRT
jgi:hypothetical protein